MSEKIPVGISACLLGEAVRYDGGHKRLAFAVEELSPWVAFEPVCPEMGIGLPVPRPALHLVKEGEAVSLRFSDKREGDLTDVMTAFSQRQSNRLEHLAILSVQNPPVAVWNGCGSTTWKAKTTVKRDEGSLRPC